MAPESPAKLSAMHHRHLEVGATMAVEGGWQRPASYAGSDQELEAARRGVALCDVSPAGKLLIQGAEMGPFLQSTATGGGAPGVGQATRQDLVDGDGSVLDRGLLCRLAHDEVLVLTSPEQARGVATSLGQRMDGCLHLVDMTSTYAGMLVAGPRSRETLGKVTDLDLLPEAFPDLSCAQVSVAQVHAIVVRADRGDVPCYEVYATRDLGQFLWDAITDAGREFDIVPMGVEAVRRLGEGG